ncbi:MAG: hypothetical protein LVQ96_02695 [Thermoplasmatales archaeon]|nr:hypothetical protein [Thermoplasmatales archaeon]MCW6170059.1 hypothetical protein [Thermoplasmatales archaeon]
MVSEKALYAIIAAVVLIGGVGIGVGYYHVITTAPVPVTQKETSLTLVITPNNYFKNATISHRQPAYFVLEPNGTLGSSAKIVLPAHTLISLTIIDYDSGVATNIGPNGTANVTSYTNFTGTVGNVGYVYNGTAQYVNGTLSGNSTNNITISHGAGWKVHHMPWNSTFGGWEVTHTFTILNGTQIMLNVPSWAGDNPNGGGVTHTSFYINQTGTFSWQCFVPCGNELDGWGGAMATPGWMMGVVQVD